MLKGRVFLVGNGCFLLIRNNYALKIGAQTFPPTEKKKKKKGRFMRKNDQGTDEQAQFLPVTRPDFSLVVCVFISDTDPV